MNQEGLAPPFHFRNEFDNLLHSLKLMIIIGGLDKNPGINRDFLFTW